MTQQQQLTEQIANLDQIIGENGEQTLLEAISKQRWYGFKNKREIVFDTWTGVLFPNFEYMSYISLNDWGNKQKNYAPNEIGKGEWQCLHDIYYYSSIEDKMVFANWKEYGRDVVNLNLVHDFPLKFTGERKVHFYYQTLKVDGIINGASSYEVCGDDFDKTKRYFKYSYKSCWENELLNIMVFPVLHILKNDELSYKNSRLTTNEKAKFFLEFFLENHWIPIFEPFLKRKEIKKEH